MSEKQTDISRLRRGAHNIPISVEVDDDIARAIEDAFVGTGGESARELLADTIQDDVRLRVEELRRAGKMLRLEELEKERDALRKEIGPPALWPDRDPDPDEAQRKVLLDEGDALLGQRTDDEDHDEADEAPPVRPEGWDAAKGRGRE